MLDIQKIFCGAKQAASRLFILILVLFVFLQATNKARTIFFFKLNQAYIAENLCENRTRPQMMCSGKCVLEKQMTKEDNSGKLLQESIKNAKDFIGYLPVELWWNVELGMPSPFGSAVSSEKIVWLETGRFLPAHEGRDTAPPEQKQRLMC